MWRLKTLSKTSERQEEQKIAEDKRKGINEGSDEAGPSVFCPTYADYTSWTTTQGSAANRQSRAGSQEVEADSDSSQSMNSKAQ